ncbi:MAG: hypothetical protein NTW68_09910 [candidate division NC10 bacterium]|nr:hypothetical protein [candidate division NC10 bacterium]
MSPRAKAGGGDECVAAPRQGPVDILLSGLGMPEMSRRDVARAVKATAPDLSVIPLTGWGEQPTNQPEDPSVVDRIFAKPVRLSDLLTAIREVTTPAVPLSA